MAMPQRWTPVFERISDLKRRRVLESAKAAFARNGFSGTNVNLVASVAGISVGALYKYFRTKEDLFIAIVDESRDLIQSTIDGILRSERSFSGRIEALLKAAVLSALEDPDLIKLYVACTSEELADLAPALSERVESASAVAYGAMVAEAQASGEVRAEVDPRYAAFLVDDILLAAQFSFASSYYSKRLSAFIGPQASPEAVVEASLDFILRALAPGKPDTARTPKARARRSRSNP